jgi:hypothetical protein
MSTLAVNTITNAAGGNTAQINGMTPTAQSLQGFRNRIINGDMRIDQRNAGASVSLTDGLYYIDRWKASISQTSKLTGQRSSIAPAGFVNSLSATVSTAFTPGTNDYAGLVQSIEGNNVSDFGFGTSSASTVTLSFWVRSSVTGTYSVALHNGAADRSYVATYTINAANTWEQKTVTIVGDTSGTWLTDTGSGITAYFALGMGSLYGGATAGIWNASLKLAATGQTQWVSTSGATFYITGVQLEAGSVATPFERIDYGRQLIQCQRYCQVYRSTGGEYDYLASGMFYSTTQGRFFKPLLVTMRTAPTFSSSTVSVFRVDGINYITLSALSLEAAEPEAVRLGFTASSAGSHAAGQGCFLASSTGNTESLSFFAEL